MRDRNGKGRADIYRANSGLYTSGKAKPVARITLHPSSYSECLYLRACSNTLIRAIVFYDRYVYI